MLYIVADHFDDVIKQRNKLPMPYFDGLIVEIGLLISFEIVVLIHITNESAELRSLYVNLSYVPRAPCDLVSHMLLCFHALH